MSRILACTLGQIPAPELGPKNIPKSRSGKFGKAIVGAELLEALSVFDVRQWSGPVPAMTPYPKQFRRSPPRYRLEIGQANAVWQWYNCAAASLPEGRAPLRINLDETSVSLFQGATKGAVFFRKRKDPPHADWGEL